MSEQIESTVEAATSKTVTRRCPVCATKVVQIEDPDFGLCWSCPLCGFLEPVE